MVAENLSWKCQSLRRANGRRNGLERCRAMTWGSTFPTICRRHLDRDTMQRRRILDTGGRGIGSSAYRLDLPDAGAWKNRQERGVPPDGLSKFAAHATAHRTASWYRASEPASTEPLAIAGERMKKPQASVHDYRWPGGVGPLKWTSGSR